MRTLAARALPVIGVAAVAMILLLLVLPSVRAAPRGSFADAVAPVEIGGGGHVLRIANADLSADGRRIAFDVPGRTAGSGAVWTARPDESLAHPAVSCTARPCLRITDPAFSPTGDQLLVVQVDTGRRRSRLLVVDPRTGTRREVAVTRDGSTSFAGPRWTADGRGAVVQRVIMRGGSSGPSGSVIQVVPLSTGRARTITPPALLAAQPDVRRSDGLVVFAAGAGGALFTVRADGTGLHRLTRTGTTRFLHPKWQPGGRRLGVVIGSLRGTHPGTGVPAQTATVDFPSGAVSSRR